MSGYHISLLRTFRSSYYYTLDNVNKGFNYVNPLGMDTQMHEATKHAKKYNGDNGQWYLASAYIYVSPGNDI